MKNKKINLFIIMTALLLTGCNNKKEQKDEYHYESDNWEISFDYSFKEDLKKNLDSVYIADDEEMSETNFKKFLSILSLNDYYANKVTYIVDEQLLYLDKDDVTKLPGDYIKQTRYDLKRNNASNSLSGTITIHDEAWNKVEGSTEVEHKNVETSGTYSLTHSEVSGVGKEIITCSNENYSSTKSIGFSQQIWGNKMNLTQSQYIGSRLSEDYKTMMDVSNAAPEQYKPKSSLRCKKTNDAVHVSFSTTLSLETTSDSVVEVSYYDSVKIAGGMIVETEHKRVEIDKTDTHEFVIKLDREYREISYE